MWRNKKWLTGIGAALLALVLLAGCGGGNANEAEGNGGGGAPNNNTEQNDDGQAGNPGDVVASYEGGEVTQEEFDRFKGFQRIVMGMYYDQLMMMDPNFERSLVEQQIGLRIIASRIEDFEAEAEERAQEDVDQVKQDMEENQEAGAWDSMLQEAGTTEEAIALHLKEQYMLYEYFERNVDEQAVQETYDNQLEENPNAFDIASVRHILISFEPEEGERTNEEALGLAQDIRQQLVDGADFAALAEEVSEDPGSTQPGQGGLYADADVNNWVPEFKQATIELPLDEISEPIETAYGYHVLRVESRSTLSLDDKREEIQSVVIQENIGRFLEEELPDLITENNVPEGEGAGFDFGEMPPVEAPVDPDPLDTDTNTNNAE